MGAGEGVREGTEEERRREASEEKTGEKKGAEEGWGEGEGETADDSSPSSSSTPLRGRSGARMGSSRLVRRGRFGEGGGIVRDFVDVEEVDVEEVDAVIEHGGEEETSGSANANSTAAWMSLSVESKYARPSAGEHPRMATSCSTAGSPAACSPLALFLLIPLLCLAKTDQADKNPADYVSR